MKEVITVVGARPQIVKAGIVGKVLRDAAVQFNHRLVHTGQHYDDMMSDIFFRELAIESPVVNLDVGSHSAASQLALMVERLAQVFQAEAPDLVVVYGDTNSTLAAAIVASMRDVPVVHVEAGERIYRRREVPEELNRVLTDEAATLCLTCTQTARLNLLWEGFAEQRVRFVGDPMFDLFLWGVERVDSAAQVSAGSFGLDPDGYHLATIHRIQNTSSPGNLRNLLDGLDASSLPVMLPVHPRVRRILMELDWEPRRNLRLIDPLGYFDFLRLLLDCRRVATDSGGVTREAFFAGKPSIVPMENSWWSEVAESGWSVSVGDDFEALTESLDSYEPRHAAPIGLFGDGDASGRIVESIAEAAGSAPSLDGPWHHSGRFESIPPVRASSFSFSSYRALLERFLENDYRFVPFGHVRADTGFNHGLALLRHDVDLDPSPAADLAELEHELDIRATYFFMLRNDFYNLFSPAHQALVRKVLQFGHSLGLHFDCSAYPAATSVEQVAQETAREVTLLEDWFEQAVEVVSFHRPDPLVLDGDAGLSVPLPHTYMKRFTSQIRYVSDSGGRWRDGDPTESDDFRARRSFQILVHPVWWSEHPISPYRRLERFVRTSQERVERSLAANSLVYRPYRAGEKKP